MKSQILHTVWCNISGDAAGEIWSWSLLGVKGLVMFDEVRSWPSVHEARIPWELARGCRHGRSANFVVVLIASGPVHYDYYEPGWPRSCPPTLCKNPRRVPMRKGRPEIFTKENSAVKRTHRPSGELELEILILRTLITMWESGALPAAREARKNSSCLRYRVSLSYWSWELWSASVWKF